MKNSAHSPFGSRRTWTAPCGRLREGVSFFVGAVGERAFVRRNRSAIFRFVGLTPIPDPPQRNESVLEGEVRDEPPLECASAFSDLLGRRVERLCDGFHDIREARARGLHLRTRMLFASLLFVEAESFERAHGLTLFALRGGSADLGGLGSGKSGPLCFFLTHWVGNPGRATLPRQEADRWSSVTQIWDQTRVRTNVGVRPGQTQKIRNSAGPFLRASAILSTGIRVDLFGTKQKEARNRRWGQIFTCHITNRTSSLHSV